jgi:hypothetical protein
MMRLLLAVTLTAAHADAQTLREVLANNGVNPPAAVDFADSTVTSWDVLKLTEGTVLAYLIGSDRIGIVDTRGGWRHRMTALSVLGRDLPDSHQLVGVNAAGNAVYVKMHLSPSAALTYVAGDDLALRDAVHGWVVAGFADGSVLVHANQVHFSRVHPLELFHYVPVTRDTMPVYPLRPPSAAWRAHRDRVAAAYAARGEDWFRINNHPMDPGRSTSWLMSDVAVDNATRAAAFVVAYDNRETWRDPERPEGPEETRVLVVCRGIVPRAAPDCRELALDDVALLDVTTPADALGPEAMRRIFDGR